jgi:GNAT superfamily N-acetyltransferase
VEPLDRYFQTQAAQEARRKIAAPFVLVLKDGSLAGYYTLSSTAVRLPELPEAVVRKLPRYPLIPATLLGRLAVDHRYQGRGYGRFLLAVNVDAKNEGAKRFYERESFLPFPDQPMKLFRPMADIEALFK